MKKLYKYIWAYIFCFACYTPAQAQHKYIPIPEDSAIWITSVENWHEGVWPPEPHTFSYEVQRTDGIDTVVNGKRYASFHGDWQATDLPLPPPKSYPAYYGEWFRQDTLLKKIWLVRHKSPPYTEELLYDFSLAKGDTINDANSSYFSPQKLAPYKAWVDDVDSIYWIDGTWRYRWWIKSKYGPINNPANVVQIEGMGYTTHFLDDPLLEFHSLISTTHKVVCFKSKQQWLYTLGNPWNTDCDTLLTRNIVDVADIRTDDLSQPIIYPNPVAIDGVLNINKFAAKNQKPLLLEAYDIIGRKVLRIQARPGDEVNLASYQLQRGIYFFIISTDTCIAKQKILVQ